MSGLGGTRRSLYRYARVLGDVQALMSDDPKRIAKRYANKQIGRRLVRRAWSR